MQENLTSFGLQINLSGHCCAMCWRSLDCLLFLTLPSPRAKVGLPCGGGYCLCRHPHAAPTSGHLVDVAGPICSASKAPHPNLVKPAAAANRYWARRALHPAKTRVYISLPSILSFMANIARKRLEINRRKTKQAFRFRVGQLICTILDVRGNFSWQSVERQWMAGVLTFLFLQAAVKTLLFWALLMFSIDIFVRTWVQVVTLTLYSNLFKNNCASNSWAAYGLFVN